MKNQFTVIVLAGLLALAPLQQSAQAQQVDPLPVPRLTLNSVRDYRNLGTQFTYTFSVINWAEFQKQVDQRYDVFDPATMQLPPSPCKIEGNTRFDSRMAAIIYSGEGKPLSCYPLFTPKGQLAEIKLNLPKTNAPNSFYLVIKDLLNKQSVKSNTVDTGSHNRTLPITNVSNVQLQGVPEAAERSSRNGGPQPASTVDLPKVLVAQAQREWEYSYDTVSNSFPTDADKTKIALYGINGWELTAVVREQYQTVIIFKRPKQVGK